MTTVTLLKRFTARMHYPAVALALLNLGPLCIMAQEDHNHAAAAAQQESAKDQQSDAAALLKVVRQATERYKDVAVAEADGYALQFGCVSGSDDGAMGLHYVNGAIVNSGALDPTRPQIVIYEALPDGTKRLIGADFLVFADAWNKTHSGPPQLMGQLFHLFDAPNRFGLPAFYTLHVWAWKKNPKGAFVNWHPNVSCESFAPQQP
jgi:hypothetical protein